MTIWATIVTFVCVWWVVIFTILPIGHVRDEEAAQKGFANSAPVAPKLKQKMLITTVIAVVVTAIIYCMVSLDIVSFREMIQEWE